jgi:hypothetical protein
MLYDIIPATKKAQIKQRKILAFISFNIFAILVYSKNTKSKRKG